jgi:phosphoglycolate phosphatase
MYEAAGVDFSRHSFDEIAEEWHAIYLKEMPNVALHADVGEVLTRVREQGIEQRVLSALPHQLLVEGVEKHGLSHFFTQVVGLSDFAGVSKVENGKKMMEEISSLPSQVVMIGDSTHDVEVAKTLSVQCVLVTCGYEDEERLMRHGVPVFAGVGEAARVVLDGMDSQRRTRLHPLK